MVAHRSSPNHPLWSATISCHDLQKNDFKWCIAAISQVLIYSSWIMTVFGQWCAQYASCVYTCAVKDMVVSKSGEAIKNTSPVWLCTSNRDGSLRRKVTWAFVPMSASVALTAVTDVPTGAFSTRDAVYVLWLKTGRLSLTSYRERKVRHKPMRYSQKTSPT